MDAAHLWSRGVAALRHRVVRPATARAEEHLIDGLLSRGRLGSGVHYGVLSSAFRREHFAVAEGKRRYRHSVAGAEPVYLLRRNVHMIEKGLVMRPRRPVFALDYIEATASAFGALASSPPTRGTDELRWAEDVLSEYFDAVRHDPPVVRAHREFTAALAGQAAGAGAAMRRAPYARDLSSAPPVTIEELTALAVRRRSVRWFEDRPVDRDVIDKAMAVAALAPSACNRQPFHFRVIDDPELVQSVADVPMGTRGYAHNIPVIVVIVGHLGAFFSERDRHLIYTDGCLAAMSFILALETQGIASCCINWPDIPGRERRMGELLDLATDQRVVMLLALGHPDPEGRVPYSQKRPLDVLRRYNLS